MANRGDHVIGHVTVNGGHGVAKGGPWLPCIIRVNTALAGFAGIRWEALPARCDWYGRQGETREQAVGRQKGEIVSQ